MIKYPEENIALLKDLKTKYRTFLMSNTDEIHYQYYTRMLHEQFGIEKLDNLFEKAYYSHKTGIRKPDKLFFDQVINDNGLIPENTLFIDDFPENISAAEELGLQTVYLNGFKLTDIF